ncbi:MAG TPA: GNAT family N-acetyltransferase [Solirubrobacteraceae bacterium]|nr:GNAT family N-acetyltransferase [Solirubrobacteraceae bacterium]
MTEPRSEPSEPRPEDREPRPEDREPRPELAAAPGGAVAEQPGTAPWEVRPVRDPRELQAAVALRHEVFCVEQGVPAHEELDGHDAQGLHLVAVREGEVLATCRLLFVGPTVQFSRLAVRRSERRRGIATALLREADERARAGGARRIVLHAQTYARALYEAAGYRARGRAFVEAGIEHIAMEKVLD